MSEIELKIVNKLHEFKLLSRELKDEDIVENLSKVYYGPIVIKNLNSDNVDEYLSKLKSLITNNCQFQNIHELSTLTLSSEELDNLINKLREFDSTLKFPNMTSLTVNPEVILSKLNYCQRLFIPYTDDMGVIIPEIVDENNGKKYFNRFYELQDVNSNDDYENDKESVIYSIIQRYTFNRYNRFVIVPQSVKEYIKNSLLNEDEDLSLVIQKIYRLLKEDNDFIEESSYDEIGIALKPRIQEDEVSRSTGRR